MLARLPLLALFVALPAAADERQIALKPSAGLDLVETHCQICHSLDYIQMNAPFLPQKSWDTEVHKMMKAFGAPISEEEARIIVDYLAKNYGG